MKKLIVLLILLIASLAMAAEMPMVVNTNLNTAGNVLTISDSTGTVFWSEPKMRFGNREGELLIASAKEFDQNPRRRIIKVYVVDPNPNVPMDKCILYQSTEYLTDLPKDILTLIENFGMQTIESFEDLIDLIRFLDQNYLQEWLSPNNYQEMIKLLQEYLEERL